MPERRRFARRDGARLGAPAGLDLAGHREYALHQVRALVSELDAHEHFTAGHADAVAGWACAVGERMGFAPAELLELELGALLHDLGKVRVPERVLAKPGPLDAAERRLVNRHPAWGAVLIERVPGLEPVATIVRFHHERWDGNGYPDGLAGDAIPLASRIVAVCDAYEGMTSARADRAPLPPAAAAFEVRAAAGTQFDPAVVDCFVDVLKERGWPLSPPAEREMAGVEGIP